MEKQDLGTRICIIGHSNSGKSTLAEAMGRALGLLVTHLDQLAHKTGTNWERVPIEESRAAHNEIIKGDKWIIDGSYRKDMNMVERFERATFIIWLDMNLIGCVWRYFVRCLKTNKKRSGDLIGATNQFNLGLAHYILTKSKSKNKKYPALIEAANKPNLHVTSMRALNKFYKELGLTRS